MSLAPQGFLLHKEDMETRFNCPHLRNTHVHQDVRAQAALQKAMVFC